MYQHCFSQSDQNYDERNFTARACVNFTGGTNITETNISTSVGMTQEEAEASSSLEVATRLIIRGGTKETRSKLYVERSGELMARFLAEANWEEPIGYSFTAVWTLLGQRYIGAEHYAKVRHLEGYYLRKKNFGWPLIMPNGWAMQVFTTNDRIQLKMCHRTNAIFLIRVDSDCHYGPGIFCQCYGQICFKDETTILDTGEQRLSVTTQLEEG